VEQLRCIFLGPQKVDVISWFSRWRFARLRTFGIQVSKLLETDTDVSAIVRGIQAFMDPHRSITDLSVSTPPVLAT
jgi:hypothetical protein